MRGLVGAVAPSLRGIRDMTKPEKDGCEVRVAGAWTATPLAEAHSHHRDDDKRCPACHGPVRTHGTYGVLQHVKMQHRRKHDGAEDAAFVRRDAEATP